MKGRADKRGKKGGGKANDSPQMPVGYLAEILGQLQEVSGWEDGKWLLAGGARYGFTPLHENGPGFHGQSLLAVSYLRLKEGEWLLDGNSLDGWLRDEEQRAEKARNVKRVKRGLKPIAFAVTPDYTFADYASGKSPPSSSAETRRLDLHPHYWRRRYLLAYLEGVMPVGGNEFDGTGREDVRAVAWFNGVEEDGDPVLLRDFWRDEQPAKPPTGFVACGVCGWSHDAKFTLIQIPGRPPIRLEGVLSEIVAQIHKAHEQGHAPMNTKDVKCRGYSNPSKAFYDLRKRQQRAVLFDTSRKGFIALRVVMTAS